MRKNLSIQNIISRLAAWFLLAVLALASGCSKTTETVAAQKQERAGNFCSEHQLPEDECGICHPELALELAPGQGLKVRFPSADAAQKAGLETALPKAEQAAEGVNCYAEIAFNQNKYAAITPLAGGIIMSVEADLGDRVEEGAILARITSASISEAKNAYLRALAELRLRERDLERERNLRAQRISAEKDLYEAIASHQSALANVEQARQRLATLGFAKKQIEALSENTPADAVLEVRAPFAGEIVERNAVRGTAVEAGKSLFMLADTTTMWGMLNIPESQLAQVKTGQTVELTVESVGQQKFTGKLTWIAAKIDDRTRMAKARAEFPNPDGLLKAQMFARAFILVGANNTTIVIPASAVQRIGGRPFAFVKLADDLFEARRLRVCLNHENRVEVVEGMELGEAVVTRGSFLAKSQLLLSRLGAGCVDE